MTQSELDQITAKLHEKFGKSLDLDADSIKKCLTAIDQLEDPKIEAKIEQLFKIL